MEKGGKRRPHADVDVWPEKDSTTKASSPLAKKLREQAERGKQKYMTCREKQQQKEQQRQQQQMERRRQQEQREQEQQQELQEGRCDGAPQGKPRKYNEVVRKKDQREALPGYACHVCRDFFRSLAPFGWPGGPQMPTCGHVLADAQPGSSLAKFQEDLIQENSKHRAQFAPPQTPPGFWELGFPDEAACELAAEAAEKAAAAAAAAAEAVAAAEAALAVVGGAGAGQHPALAELGAVQAAAGEAGSPPATQQRLHALCAEQLSL
uniref:DNA endonuclease activator Ctp1 C-terminal domain-containing protein n=1 Tax=Dunaliella tertiolecta TaxID=3047 RepID=A0A7S3R6Q2_DUNTE